jgi:TatA/E family protein of Tat protein translocase
MVGDIMQPTHLLFVLVIALLVLGPKRLPEVGRTLGTGLRDFRSAISGETPAAHHEERPTPEYVHAPPQEPLAPPVQATVVAEPVVAAATEPAAGEHDTQVRTSEPLA